MSGPNVVKVKSAVGLQHSTHFAKRGVEVVAPLEHQVADRDIDAGVGERQFAHIAADSLEAAEESHVLAGFAQHAGRDVERDDVRILVAALQLAGEATGAGAEVHDARRATA